MEIIIGILVGMAMLIISSWLFLRSRKKVSPAPPMPESSRVLLEEHVLYYQNLDQPGKKEFETRVMQFLRRVRISGIHTEVDELDRVLIAASAIIPIFGFSDWEYIHLNEILLYPGSFNHDFDQEGSDRTILGMVGDGALEDVMLLSRHDLRQAFLNSTGKFNTAIHEFVHLLDKTDGSVDGIPESLLSKQYVIPWIEMMRRKIKQIQASQSDINPYAATSDAEFLAVVSEYFFERPDLLREKHPGLYEMLTHIFQQQPVMEKRK